MMATLVELEKVECLLGQATLNQRVSVGGGEPLQVARIDKGVDLVYGIFPYRKRAVGVPGRLLTYELTQQPVLAVREGSRITPLPYAEDIISHPLRKSLEASLRSFVPGG